MSLALKAFEMTARYDEVIGGHFREQYTSAVLPVEKLAGPAHSIALKYGANPHQKPAHAYISKGELPFKGEWVFILQTLETACNMCFVYQQLPWWIKDSPELFSTGLW